MWPPVACILWLHMAQVAKEPGKAEISKKRSSEDEADFLASDFEDIHDLLDLDVDKGLPSTARERQEATNQKTLEALSFLQVITYLESPA